MRISRYAENKIFGWVTILALAAAPLIIAALFFMDFVLVLNGGKPFTPWFFDAPPSPAAGSPSPPVPSDPQRDARERLARAQAKETEWGWKSAMGQYDAAVDQWPGVETLEARSDAFARIPDYEAADRDLATALTSSSAVEKTRLSEKRNGWKKKLDAARRLSTAGTDALREGRYADAERLFTQALEAGAGFEALEGRARGRIQVNRFSEARQDLSDAIPRAPHEEKPRLKSDLDRYRGM